MWCQDMLLIVLSKLVAPEGKHLQTAFCAHAPKLSLYISIIYIYIYVWSPLYIIRTSSNIGYFTLNVKQHPYSTSMHMMASGPHMGNRSSQSSLCAIFKISKACCHAKPCIYIYIVLSIYKYIPYIYILCMQ